MLDDKAREFNSSRNLFSAILDFCLSVFFCRLGSYRTTFNERSTSIQLIRHPCNSAWGSFCFFEIFPFFNDKTVFEVFSIFLFFFHLVVITVIHFCIASGLKLSFAYLQ